MTPSPAPRPSSPQRPLLLDDDWEPPPRPKRRRVAGTMALLVTACVTFVTIRAAIRKPDAARFTEDAAGSELAKPTPATTRNDLWYPDDSLESPLSAFKGARGSRSSSPVPVPSPARRPALSPAPARPAPAPAPAASPARPAPLAPPRVPPGPAYLSVNSTPWATLSVDGHVVGDTPQPKISVMSGRHELTFARDGFATQRTWVIVQPGATLRITDIELKRIWP